MSVSVLVWSCSRDQTALQVATDAGTLSQEESRTTVNTRQNVQHVLQPLVSIPASRMIAVFTYYTEIFAKQSLYHKCVLSRNDALPLLRIE